VAAQCLHALSFGACHFAAMRIITEKVDPALSSTAQGIYSAFSMGIGMGVFVLLSGPMYGAWQGLAFMVMGVVALAGTVCMALLPAHMEKIVDTAPAVSESAAVQHAA
jgi:PPP family 3-phenylpropionic acid transporter